MEVKIEKEYHYSSDPYFKRWCVSLWCQEYGVSSYATDKDLEKATKKGMEDIKTKIFEVKRTRDDLSKAKREEITINI